MKGSLLSVTLYITAGGILTQALLAGMFLSGTGGARMVHVIVGWLLPYFAIVPVVSAWRAARRGLVPRSVAVGTTALLIGLWIQESLGHMPFPVTTAVHVPFGVLLFGLSIHLGYKAAASLGGSRGVEAGR